MATRETIIKVQLENRDAIKQLGQYEAELIAVRKETNALTATIRKNNEATPEQSRRLGELRSTAKALSGNIRELSNETSGLTAAGMRFRDKMAGATTQALQSFGLQIFTIGGAVAALSSAFSNAIQITADFDKSQSNLAAIMGKTKAEITDLTEQAKQLGSTTAFTASQVADAQTELAKLGFTAAQVTQATPGILALAAATGTDLANAATIAAQTLNAFQLDASETARIVDVIAQSANLSAFDIDTFSAAMSNAAPAAKSVGVEIEDAAAMLSALVDAGIPAEKAGTDLRNIFIALAKEGKTMDEAFAEVRASTNQLSTAVEMFDQRAAGSAIILAENTEKLGRLKEAYRDAAGTAQEMADKQLDNLQGDRLLLQSAWEGFVLSVDDGSGVITDGLRGVVTQLTEMVGLLQKLNESETVGDGLSSIAAILGKLPAGLRALVAPGSFVSDLFAKDIPEGVDAMAESIDYAAVSTSDLEKQLKGLKDVRDAFLKQGKEEAAEEGDLKIAVLERFIAMRKATAATGEATVETEVNTAATDANTDAKGRSAAATDVERVKVQGLTSAMRDLVQQYKDLESGIVRVEALRMPEVASPLTPVEDRLLGPGTTIDQLDVDSLDYQNSMMAAADANAMFTESTAAVAAALGSVGSLFAEQSAEFKAFATAEALISTYLGVARALSDPTIPNTFARIAASVSVLAAGLRAVARIQGFEEGGYTSKAASNKKPVGVVHANEWVAPAWMVNSKEFAPTLQQLEEARRRRANRMAGFAKFAAPGVPGFEGGGNTTYTLTKKRTGLMAAPRPSPAELNATRNALSMMQTPIYVAVEEINRVQGRVARIQERATL